MLKLVYLVFVQLAVASAQNFLEVSDDKGKNWLNQTRTYLKSQFTGRNLKKKSSSSAMIKSFKKLAMENKDVIFDFI
jgi:hypothetical protein